MTIWGVGFNASPSDGYDFTKHAKAIKLMGCREVRYGLSWRVVEPAQGEFNWAYPDWMVDTAAKAGLRVLPIPYRTPAWIGTHDSPPPPNLYAEFVARVANRYGAFGTFWNGKSSPQPIMSYEIWNEPNLAGLDWKGTPEQYAAIYRAAQGQLKRLNPKYEAIVGGLAYPDGSEYLRALWPKLEPVDAVGYHPYGLTVKHTYELIGSMRYVLAKLGHPKVPIDITEIGLPVGWSSPHYTEGERCRYLKEMARTIQGKQQTRRFITYTWFREPTVPPQGWNIGNDDGSFKPSARAYAEGIRG